MDNFEDNEFECSEDYEKIDWTIVLPPENLDEVSKNNGNANK